MTDRLQKTKYNACKLMGLFLALLMLLLHCSWLTTVEALQALNGTPTLMERLQLTDQAAHQVAHFQTEVPIIPNPDRKAIQNYWDWFVGTGCDGLDSVTPSPKSSGLGAPAVYLETVWTQAAPRPVDHYLTSSYHDFGHLKVMAPVDLVQGINSNLASYSQAALQFCSGGAAWFCLLKSFAGP